MIDRRTQNEVVVPNEVLMTLLRTQFAIPEDVAVEAFAVNADSPEYLGPRMDLNRNGLLIRWME